MDVPSSTEVTAFCYLVEADTRTVITKGFQAGDVKMIRPGQTIVKFTKLKLNKMRLIKDEIAQDKSTFFIQIVVGGQSVYSDTFKLVSRYFNNQLLYHLNDPKLLPNTCQC